jgi:uncharacterized membrane protein YqgA involved in biofilm formation
VTGTILNAIGILVGGLTGLFWIKQMSAHTQQWFKILLGVATVAVGLHLAWSTLSGGWANIGRQLIIAVLALTFGRLTGRLLRIQKGMNRIGQHAKERMASPSAHNFNDAFVVCTLLFCFAPLGIVGAVLDGLGNQWPPLAIKAAMDGLGTLAFAAMLGRGVLLSAFPVLAWQGTIALAARALAPWLEQHALLSSVQGIGGLLVFCVALVILELKRIELGDYLPSLAFAPLLTWLWH